jgi:hypothetical protein
MGDERVRGRRIAAAMEHGTRVHNMRPTREEVLAMVVRDPEGE